MKARRFDFYPDDWLAGTMTLGNADRGLYITVCAMIWSHGGPIEIDELFASCADHATSLKNQLKRLVDMGKLSVKGSQIINKRALNELQKAGKRVIKASQNGRKGGLQTSKNNKLAAAALQQQSQGPPQLPSPSPSPSPSEEESKKKDTQVGVQKGCRLPVDFVMPEVWNEVGWTAREKAHLPPIDLATESVKFCNYWWSKAGRDGTKSDWEKTWINWCLNAKGVSNGRYDRHAADEAGHARALAVLRDSAIEHDDGKGYRGPAKAPH